MKVNKRQLLILGVSGLLVASAIAIPVGIVYGTSRTVTTTETTPSPVEVTSQTKVAYSWGADFGKITAPALAETGYDVANYEAGIFDQIRNLDKTKSIADNLAAKAAVLYKYVPKTGKNLPVVTVAYLLDIKQSVSKALADFTANAKLSKPDITYGTQTLPLTVAEANVWFEANGFGYRVKSGTSPQYLKSDGTALTARGLSTLAAGQTFTVAFQTSLDTEHYSDKNAKGEALATDETFTFTYKVAPAPLAANGDVVANNGADIEIIFGDDFTLPTPPADAQKPHFALKSTNGTSPDEPFTRVTNKPAGATNTPDLGQPIVAANVKNYEHGTKFEVTYTYATDSANYSSREYKYTFKYVLPELKDIVRPTVASTGTGTLANVAVEYAKFASTAAPAAPAYDGYKGTLTSTKVTTASAVAGTNSPAAGTDVDWTSVNSYNAGTAFELTFSYVNDGNHKTDAFTLKQTYSISKQKIALDDINNTEQPYVVNADPSSLTSGVTNPGLAASGTVKYYDSNNAEIDAAAVKALAVGSRFRAEWNYVLANTDNYESTNSAKTTMKVTKSFLVQTAATYTGAMTYQADTFKVGRTVPTDFVPNALPEPDLNTGYELKPSLTKYAITKASDDGVTALSSIPNLNSLNDYHNGAEITGTFTFVPSTGYAGNNIEVTKVLKVAVDTDFDYVFNWTGSGSGNYNSVFFSTWNGSSWVKVNITEDMIVEFTNAAITTKADLVTYINGTGGTNKLIQGNLYVKLEIPMESNLDNSARNLSLKVEGYRHPDRTPPVATLTVTGKQSGYSYSPTAVPTTEKAGWNIVFNEFSEDLLTKA